MYKIVARLAYVMRRAIDDVLKLFFKTMLARGETVGVKEKIDWQKMSMINALTIEVLVTS